MKFTLGWLREYVEPNDTLLEDLMSLGFPTEVRKLSLDDRLVAAKVVKCEKLEGTHLSLCEVWDSEQSFQVICGASNVRENLTTVFAKPGSHLPCGKEIKITTIRGVESQGMLCSYSEICVPIKSDGIIELSDAHIGCPAYEILRETVEVYTTEVPHNRNPSILLLALELRAKNPNLQIKNTELISNGPEIATHDIPGCVSVFCKMQTLPTVTNRNRFACITGLNTLEDYVLHDCGTLLHMMDAQKISGKLHCRLSRSGDNIDGQILPNNLPVIQDDQGLVCVMGVMIADRVSCDEKTRETILNTNEFFPNAEIAEWMETHSRSVACGVHKATTVMARAIKMAGQTPTSTQITGSLSERILKTDDKLYTISGYNEGEIQVALSRLGIESKGQNEWSVPPSRNDIQSTEYLAGEVTRVLGLRAEPTRSFFVAHSTVKNTVEKSLRHMLCSENMAEVMNKSITHLKGISIKGTAKSLRTSILPQLLSQMSDQFARNVKQWQGIFEVGTVFSENEEKRNLAVLLNPYHCGYDKLESLFFKIQTIVGKTFELIKSSNNQYKIAGAAQGWMGIIDPSDSYPVTNSPVYAMEVTIPTLKDIHSSERFNRAIPQAQNYRDITLISDLHPYTVLSMLESNACPGSEVSLTTIYKNTCTFRLFCSEDAKVVYDHYANTAQTHGIEIG